MSIIDMTKKSNYLAAQGKEDKAQCDLVEVLTDEEIEKIRAEAFKKFDNGKPVYQQSAAYFLMLNTGMRAGEACGIINSDIDLEKRVIHLQRGVKEVHVRENMENQGRLEVQVGKLKSATSKRDIPLNENAIEMIKSLQEEVYLGEDAPLIPDENGTFTNPRNMRTRFQRILKAAGLEKRGLHVLRHTFATTLINGIRQPDGTLKTLGLDAANWILLIACIVGLYFIDSLHERGVHIRESIDRQHIVFRWVIYLLAIDAIIIFGIYGPGYDSATFIYEQF